MRISYNLKIEQTQKLIMTPELQQAINLLQLSSQELQLYVQNELLNNPVLEIDEGEENEKKSEEAEDSPDQLTEKDPIDWDEYLRDEGLDSLPHFTVRQDNDAPAYDYFLTKEPTLQEYLLHQLGLCNLSRTEKHIGEFLIGNIEHNGYLKTDINECAMLLGVGDCEMISVLEIIQKLDPAGIGARDLRECLLLQMRECTNIHPLAKKIVEHYLHYVADNKFKKIASELRVDPASVQAAVDFIRTLDPKPGRRIGDVSDVRYVVPDVVVEKVAGEYVVMVEHSTSRLTINPYYRSLLGSEKRESLTSTFIKSRLDSALWLLRSIEQRRMTLYRVTECIVRMQQAFFEEGIKQLRPMTLRQIAEDIGVHESTVSRATANKYAQTPRGMYSLKFFFASGVEDDHGTAVSSQSVKSHLQELIDAENVQRPLSDQKLMELMGKRGIVVSRRTVAKYREEMSVPASSKRKRI